MLDNFLPLKRSRKVMRALCYFEMGSGFKRNPRGDLRSPGTQEHNLQKVHSTFILNRRITMFVRTAMISLKTWDGGVITTMFNLSPFYLLIRLFTFVDFTVKRFSKWFNALRLCDVTPHVIAF